MKRKRKSIGNDPLDWMGEPSALAKSVENPEGEARQESGEKMGSTGAGNGSSPGSESDILSLSSPSPTYALERQLLLVDGALREGVQRPRLNQALWIVLVLLTVMGMGILFFQEVRRQWTARIFSLEGTVERIEKEKGRNEQMLEQVISEKDRMIREKEGTLSKIGSLHETVVDELRLARSETKRLREENQILKENDPAYRKSPTKPRKPGPKSSGNTGARATSPSKK